MVANRAVSPSAKLRVRLSQGFNGGGGGVPNLQPPIPRPTDGLGRGPERLIRQAIPRLGVRATSSDDDS